ncbi:hypothetical protein PHLGIDRAFT_118002 [Phlebiopsis gigantea 11061_1 CR5-6]|uniref:Uncharacterized protein n=1 Tax=Phlebiopsis gigantea (strain 11061_1 CR5-6) TaxID=745531 RepID=A0A0C3RZ24_PHLG1|nr:hypothetical protein PHLGIDRAFT_118002 [Phlebiopsis gigantea 11061_1 CR5-6]
MPPHSIAQHFAPKRAGTAAAPCLVTCPSPAAQALLQSTRRAPPHAAARQPRLAHATARRGPRTTPRPPSRAGASGPSPIRFVMRGSAAGPEGRLRQTGPITARLRVPGACTRRASRPPGVTSVGRPPSAITPARFNPAHAPTPPPPAAHRTGVGDGTPPDHRTPRGDPPQIV